MTNFSFYCRITFIFCFVYYYCIGDEKMNELEVIRLINKMVDNTRNIQMTYIVNMLTIDKKD